MQRRGVEDVAATARGGEVAAVTWSRCAGVAAGAANCGVPDAQGGEAQADVLRAAPAFCAGWLVFDRVRGGREGNRAERNTREPCVCLMGGAKTEVNKSRSKP